MYKPSEMELENLKSTLFYKNFRNYLEAKMENIKENLLYASEPNIRDMQTRYMVYKEIYKLIE